MSWHLFDERGRRARKLTWLHGTGEVIEGWGLRENPELGVAVFGFADEHTWRPTYFAAKMARGYRIFELDVGEHEYVDNHQLVEWWQSCSPDQKRLPTMAAVEMFLRMTA